ncbi:MAG: efflux RND transporter permease subunit, partial [Acidobacteria bacterium]|nr:efflux RND transporter permease subunit [Acidobacteriota bacterium]
VRTVRGFTDFGISYVYVIFEDGTDMYWARSRVVEYLQGIRGQLPDGVNPVIGPDATGVGWVFEYALVDETGQHTLADLRGFQDWYLRYWLAAVPGVAEVASIGGFVKQYQVNLDPNKLAAYDLAVKDVVRAIQASNNDVEGRLLEFAGREYMVRGRGYLQSSAALAGASLGGIALAIGVLVDASIVMVENAYRHLSEPEDEHAALPAYADQPAVTIRAAKQVGRAIFFSLVIIIVSFVPVFLLEAQEGRMFRPLAFTKTFAMIFASILSITLVPVLMMIFMRGKRLKPEAANPVSRFFIWLYDPALRLALRWRWGLLVANLIVVVLTVPLALRLGSEFMPPLYEGSFLYMPTAPPGMSIAEATRTLQVQDKLLRQFPEVERVFGTVGRGTTSTDNSPMGMVNTTVTLKPKDQWRPGMTTEQLQADMDESLQFAGFPNTWTQPIRNRLDMLLTGIKTPVGIKIFGPDLNEIQRIGRDIEQALQEVEGTRSVYAERVAQGYFTDIRIDRQAIARHGLTIEDVQDVIQSAIGGQNVTRTIEGRERYPVNVRYDRDFREDIPGLERVLIKTPMGSHVPLGQLAEITLTPGPAMIRDEDSQLAGYVYVDTATRDIGGYVDRARQAIDQAVTLPVGYTLLWTGQYEFQVRARERFQILIPIVFFTIFILLYMTFRSVSEAIVVLLSVVFAMTGGILLQWWMGYNFSVAVWVGYIALYGIAVQTGVIMMIYLHEALDKRLRRGGELTKQDIWDATVAGSVLRLRPKLMTVTVVMASLIPIMWSTGVGADIMQPIAAPILGGMVTSTIHVLINLPAVFYVMKVRAWRKGTLTLSGMTLQG